MAELKQHFEDLEITEEEQQYVSMKEVISKWRKKARLVHPDKVGEEHKEEANIKMSALNKSLEEVLKFVHERENKETEEEVLNENLDKHEEFKDEYSFAKEHFKRFNFPTENSNSFTININNSDAEFWRESFEELYGEPTITTHKVSEKVMDRWWKFIFEGQKVTVHLYMNEGTDSKILVQGSGKITLINYVFSELPKIYVKVRSALEIKPNNESSLFFSPKTRRQKSMTQPRGKKLVQCDNCHVMKPKEEIKVHMKVYHQSMIPLKPRSIPYRERRKMIQIKNKEKFSDKKVKKVQFSVDTSMEDISKDGEECKNFLHMNQYPETIVYEVMISCKNCDAKFSNQDNLTEHMTLIHTQQSEPVKENNCQPCNKTFVSEVELTLHTLEHSPKVIHKCAECLECFYSDVDLSNHREQAHGEKVFVVESEDTGQTNYDNQSEKAEEENTSEAEVSNISKVIEGKKQTNTECNKCQLLEKTTKQSADDLSKLKKEYEMKIKEMKETLKKTRIDRNHCNKKANNWKDKMLVAHAKVAKYINENEKLKEENKTLRKIKEVQHLLKDNKDGNVDDDNTRSNPVEENQTPTEIEKIKCRQCSFIAPNKTILKGHMTGHQKTTTREVKCAACDRKFATIEDLNRHWKDKTNCSSGQEKIRCTHCDSQFASKSQLSEHEKLKHTTKKTQKEIKCSACEVSFTTTEQLKKHWSNNPVCSPPLPSVKCNQCDFQCETNLQLKAHEKINHIANRSTYTDYDNFEYGVCKYWKNGNCSRKQCKYLHEDISDTREYQNQQNKHCRFFARGNCRFGSRCKFQHIMKDQNNGQNMQPKICKYQNNCKFLPNCRFAHMFSDFLYMYQNQPPPPLDSMIHFPPIQNGGYKPW